MLAAATASGAIPVQLTASHHHPLKLRIDSFSAASIIPSTGPYETRDGDRRTDLVFRLTDLRIRGLCLSNRVATPIGTYTLRITASTLTAARLSVALDSINSLDLLGQELNVGPLLNLLPLDNPPLGSSDDPGFLDLKLGGVFAAISITLRYFTASHFNVNNVQWASGRSKAECF
ncbi:MAG TPA: DUF6230 family protein [Pseudonocardia sp.]|nr:DUF6230 family protein [Pseudonocardia sp.]